MVCVHLVSPSGLLVPGQHYRLFREQASADKTDRPINSSFPLYKPGMVFYFLNGTFLREIRCKKRLDFIYQGIVSCFATKYLSPDPLNRTYKLNI